MMKFLVGTSILLLGFALGFIASPGSSELGYVNGCQDAFNDVYAALGLKQTNQDALEAFCRDRFQKKK